MALFKGWRKKKKKWPYLKAEDWRPQMSQLIWAEIDRLKAVSQSKYWDYMDATEHIDEVTKDKITGRRPYLARTSLVKRD